MLDKLKDKVLGPKVDIKREKGNADAERVEGASNIYHVKSQSNLWSVTISPRSGNGSVTAKFYKESEGTVFKRRNSFGPHGTASTENMVSFVHAELYNEKGEKVLACQAPWKEGDSFAQNLKNLNISAEGQSPKEQMGAEILKKAQDKLGAHIEKENQRSSKKNMGYSR